MQIVIPVDKTAAGVQSRRMHKQLDSANRANNYSTYKQLTDATRALNICRGMHEVLSGLGLIDEAEFVAEDIQRVEQKIESIYEVKRRTDRPKWRS